MEEARRRTGAARGLLGDSNARKGEGASGRPGRTHAKARDGHHRLGARLVTKEEIEKCVSYNIVLQVEKGHMYVNPLAPGSWAGPRLNLVSVNDLCGAMTT